MSKKKPVKETLPEPKSIADVLAMHPLVDGKFFLITCQYGMYWDGMYHDREGLIGDLSDVAMLGIQVMAIYDGQRLMTDDEITVLEKEAYADLTGIGKAMADGDFP